MAKIRSEIIPPSLGLSNNPNVSVLSTKGVNSRALIEKHPEGKEVDEPTEERGRKRSGSSSVRVHVKRYAWGETIIRSFATPEVDRFERQKPPSNTGERTQENGLSQKGRTRLRRAANYFQWRYKSTKMITLGYGDTSLSGHAQSKGDLRRFLKSLQRWVKSNTQEDFHYLWVAEVQEKRLERTGESVIHYHVLVPYFVPKSLVNRWWNNAVNKPREQKGLPTQRLYPQIINAYNAGRYIGKYLQKEGHKIVGNGYNMSEATSKAIQPTFEGTYDLPQEKAQEALEQAFFTIRGVKGSAEIRKDTEDTTFLWLSEAKEYPLAELWNYHLKGNEPISLKNVRS